MVKKMSKKKKCAGETQTFMKHYATSYKLTQLNSPTCWWLMKRKQKRGSESPLKPEKNTRCMSFQDSNDSFFFFLLDNIATIQNIALRNFYGAIYIIDLSYKTNIK